MRAPDDAQIASRTSSHRLPPPALTRCWMADDSDPLSAAEALGALCEDHEALGALREDHEALGVPLVDASLLRAAVGRLRQRLGAEVSARQGEGEEEEEEAQGGGRGRERLAHALELVEAAAAQVLA